MSSLALEESERAYPTAVEAPVDGRPSCNTTLMMHAYPHHGVLVLDGNKWAT